MRINCEINNIEVFKTNQAEEVNSTRPVLK